jgi:hypothetical protein
MLDPEAYDESGFGGSSNFSGGKASFGGKPSFGGNSSATAGRPTGTAGTQASAGAPSTPTTTQCAAYCSGYAATCAKELKGQDCQLVCQAEIDGYGPKCQKLGLAAIKCLTPFFKGGGGDCDTTTSKGLTQCGNKLADFKNCETGGAPVPTPTPTPTPTPGFDPATCPNMGGVSPNSCNAVFACAQGNYETSCFPTPDGKATHCYCLHNGVNIMGDMPPTDFAKACYIAAQWCPD